MESYDKENCCGNNIGDGAFKKSVLSGTEGNVIANRKKWLESGAAGRPNPTAFDATNNKNRRVSTTTGVISERRQWIASEMEKGPMTAAPKGQDIGGAGIIERQRKWVEDQMRKGPMTAAPKDQDIGGVGIIKRQRKWAEDQMQKGPMTAAQKGQDVGGAGIIERQRKWAEDQSQKQMTVQVSKRKDQDVGGRGIIERQKRRVQEQATTQVQRETPSTRTEAPARKRQKTSVVPPKPTVATKTAGVSDPTVGCYLTFETDSGGRLMLCYQQGGKIPKNAVGFWTAGEGKSIQGFKFKRAGGRSELIKGIAGGDSNRRRYFDGWCQFVKLAKAMNGSVTKFHVPGHGVEVDVYVYKISESRPSLLDLDSGLVDVSELDAVVVVPRHKNFVQGVKTMILSTFLEKGGIAGSSTLLN